MTPEEFKQERLALGMSQRKLADELGINWRTLQGYEYGKIKITRQTLKTLELLKKVLKKSKKPIDSAVR